METDKNKEKEKAVVENELLEKTADDERLDETLEKTENSNVSTNLFSKDHHRTSKAFGPGHEPGAGG
ncbi:hypothetical protein ACVWYG_003009 [Pedobacter sp. UYEF25]